ncbi:MAG: RagB/SusD family nutrient uptake outer membrane protein [Prevotellaceae bacterium]|nr:RagB/SusD family nutrient uptake outer membrane protein [Prevotellaceae bacterium]
MKKYSISIILLALTFAFTSCTDWLDYTPDKHQDIDDYFYDDANAEAAVVGIYATIFSDSDEGFSRGFMYEIAGGSDDMIYGRSRGDDFLRMTDFTYNGRESAVPGFNNNLNQSIVNANSLIAIISKMSNRSAVLNRSLGEAYFMRAFCHFFWAYRYGRYDQGVPFDRYEDYEYYTPQSPEQRESVMKNYELIIEDLQKAADLLPFFEEYTGKDYGRAHKAACWAYMVKVYAYWAQHDKSKWELIPPLVDKIRDEGKRALLPDFYDVFTIANNWSSEYIWSINCSAATNAGCYITCVFLVNQGWGKINGWGYFKPTLELRNAFVDGDKRRKVTMLEYGDVFKYFGVDTCIFTSGANDESGFMIAKYLDPYRDAPEGNSAFPPHVSPNRDGFTDFNIPLFRYAEALLFKAEALIHLGENGKAAQVLNEIRQRAGLSLLATATKEDLMRERRCELAGEYADRFMDLKRWGKSQAPNASEDWGGHNILRQPKHVRHYYNAGCTSSTTGLTEEDTDCNRGARENPYNPWVPIEVTWEAKAENRKNFNSDVHIVMPYHPDDVVQSAGKLKQNPGY